MTYETLSTWGKIAYSLWLREQITLTQLDGLVTNGRITQEERNWIVG